MGNRINFINPSFFVCWQICYVYFVKSGYLFGNIFSTAASRKSPNKYFLNCEFQIFWQFLLFFSGLEKSIVRQLASSIWSSPLSHLGLGLGLTWTWSGSWSWSSSWSTYWSWSSSWSWSWSHLNVPVVTAASQFNSPWFPPPLQLTSFPVINIHLLFIIIVKISN